MYPSCFIITCNVHFWMTMLHFFLSKMQVLFMWSRTKGSFSFIIAVFSSIVALTTLTATLAADLDVFGVFLGVKLGFFKWELNNLFNRASNSFEVIAPGDGCKMPSSSKLYFFKFEKSKFNKNNLKTCPSSNPIYLNPTLIHQVFKWKLEFVEKKKKKKNLKSNNISSCNFPEKNTTTNSNKNLYNQSIELSSKNSKSNLNSQNRISLS